MGESTKLYRSISFARVYLAGSVLRENFFAEYKFLGNRIRFVRNDIATGDWPVGIHCSGLDSLGLAEDVGTGGFNGFTDIARQDLYEEVKFYNGGHGEALELANRPTIAGWILQDLGVDYDHARTEELLEHSNTLVGERSFLWSLASRAAPGLFVFIVVFAGYLLFAGRRPLLALLDILTLMWLLNII